LLDLVNQQRSDICLRVDETGEIYITSKSDGKVRKIIAKATPTYQEKCMQFNYLLSKFRYLILIGIVMIGLALPFKVSAAEQVVSTLIVTGQGTEKIATTLTNIQLGVEVQGKTATEVQQQIAEKTNSLVQFLRSRQVEQLQTTGIQLQPNYDYGNEQRKLIGYVGINTLSFRLSTEKLGDLIDQAVQAGATRIDNISFTASDEAIANAQKQALTKAVQDAQAQADAVLQTLNLNAKSIVTIQINGANPPQPLIVQNEAFSDRVQAKVSTPIIGGEQAIEASVTLQIGY
jgi:uncharacterized protein YggE